MQIKNKSCANNSPTLQLNVNGTIFTYREFGKKEGIPIILLHHFTAVIDDWDPKMIDELAKEKWIITFDNRGVGGSEGKTPTTVQDMANDALLFIESLGLKKVDLLGFSLGGFISQVIVEKKPELVRRVILAGTGVAGRNGNDKVLTMTSDFLRGGLTLRHPKYYLFFTHTKIGKKAAGEFLNRLKERKVDRVKSSSIRTALAQSQAIYRWTTQKPMDLSKITHPVLVVNGEDDRMISTESSYELVRRLPNSSLIIYPDAGHGSIFQYHYDFVKKAIQFLS